MSEITNLWEALQQYGRLDPHEETVQDVFREWDEAVPVVPGISASSVPSELRYQYELAAEEAKNQAEVQRERQAELDHEFAKGRARSEGAKAGDDPGVALAIWKRDLPEKDRRNVQQRDELRQKILNDSFQADLKRQQAATAGNKYVADKLEAEAERLEFSARLDHEKLEALEEHGLETLREQDYAAARQSAQEVLNVFKVENCPLSHLDEKISEANKSNLNFGYARRGNDKLYKVTHEGDTIGNVFKQLREDERLENIGDHELLLAAHDMGMGWNLQIEEINPDAPSRKHEPEDAASGDIEVVSATEGGFETTEHEYEEEKVEPKGVEPRTNIRRLF